MLPAAHLHHGFRGFRLPLDVRNAAEQLADALLGLDQVLPAKMRPTLCCCDVAQHSHDSLRGLLGCLNTSAQPYPASVTPVLRCHDPVPPAAPSLTAQPSVPAFHCMMASLGAKDALLHGVQDLAAQMPALEQEGAHLEQPPFALCCRTASRISASTRRILARSVVISGSSPTSDASAVHKYNPLIPAKGCGPT